MHSIRIDRDKRLAAESHVGHNRYHPDIAPVVEVGEGEEIALETRDALDGQITPATTAADFSCLDAGAVHPLTGPVFVKGATPGDLLEIEFTDIIAQDTAFSAIMPGLGFLRDLMTEPFLVHWQIRDGWASSAEIPGVRIPGAPFMGVSGVAPSPEKLVEWTAREQRVIDAVVRQNRDRPVGPEALVEERLADYAGGPVGFQVGDLAPAFALSLRQEDPLGLLERPAQQPFGDAARLQAELLRRAHQCRDLMTPLSGLLEQRPPRATGRAQDEHPETVLPALRDSRIG